MEEIEQEYLVLPAHLRPSELYSSKQPNISKCTLLSSPLLDK
jgi:hypothetical protein